MKTNTQILNQVNKIKNRLKVKVLSKNYSIIQTLRFAKFCTKYQHIKYRLEQLNTF
jgi:hypothetical protein